MKGNYYWRDPSFASMIMGGRWKKGKYQRSFGKGKAARYDFTPPNCNHSSGQNHNFRPGLKQITNIIIRYVLYMYICPVVFKARYECRYNYDTLNFSVHLCEVTFQYSQISFPSKHPPKPAPTPQPHGYPVSPNGF